MKKILISVVFLMALFAMTSISSAYEIGQKIGVTLNTDIAAYINHYAIESHTVDGMTAIPADELEYFGFDVIWNTEQRALYISRGAKIEISPRSTVFKNKEPVGSPNLDILYTDIKTYINGVEVKSYNVGNRTMICFDELAKFGQIVWVPEVRALKLWIEGLPVAPFEYLPDENMYRTYANTNAPDFTDITGAESLQVTYSGGVSSYRYGYNVENIDYFLQKMKYLNFKIQIQNVGAEIHYNISKNDTNFVLSVNAEKELVWVVIVDNGELPLEYYPSTTLPTYTSITGVACKYTVYFSGSPSINGFIQNGEGFTYSFSQKDLDRYIYHLSKFGFNVAAPIYNESSKESLFVVTKDTEKYQIITKSEGTGLICVRTIIK